MENTEIDLEKSALILQPEDKPENVFLWGLLSLQHVFAMFGATVLVPMILGIDPSMAIFTSGVGTLIYIFFTKAKVPIYLGSSFAFISASALALEHGGFASLSMALVGVGLLYVVVSFIVRITGMNWINRVIPPIVIGPMIMVIGLSLAGGAVASAGLSADSFDATSALIAGFTLLVTALTSIIGKGFFKIIPILSGIMGGYIFSLILGKVDTSIFNNISLFSIPEFQIPFVSYQPDFSFVIMFLPIALVTIAEHIGEHSIASNITRRDFLKNPGLKNTLLGDGFATIFAGLIGGPANTTYGENNGVIAMTKIASVRVIALAAVFAIILSFLNPVALFIKSIPSPVMGGISIMLFGIIASNGVKIMIENKIDFTKSRNLIIAATMLILGIGGATFAISDTFQFSGMAMAALVGITLNLLLPQDRSIKENK